MREPARVLLIQLRRIGDVILTTPAVAALKRRYPGAKIDFLVERAGAEALEGNPDLDSVHVYDAHGLLGAWAWVRKVRALRYDWVIDYLGNPRSALITALSGASVRAGPGHVAHRWAYNRRLLQSDRTHYGALEKIRVLKTLDVPSEGADFLPRVYLAERGGDPVGAIALAPASRKETRRWPAASYGRLGRLLRERYGCEILVFWGPGERELAEEVAAAAGPGARATPATPSLRDAARLLSGCRLLVTNCSGTKHLAVGLGVPTLTIHGSSDPASWNPPHPRHVALRREELFCIGCGLNRCPYHLECLSGLAPEAVFDAACRLLDARLAGAAA